MPAVSRAQAVAARIAEHHPEKLYQRNRGLADMQVSDLMHLARTPTKGLPKHVPKKKAGA